MEILALVFTIVVFFSLQKWIFDRFAFKNLEYKCEFSVPEAYEGDEILLVETIRNRKLLPLPWLKVDIHSSRWLDFAGTCSVVTQDDRRVTSSFLLKGYQRTTRRWKLKCVKRGVFLTENVTLISGDLLNMGSNSIPHRVDAKLVVYPEILKLEELLVPVNLMQGETIVRRWIVDDPFIVAGVREYQSTDPSGRIHWSATAKEGRLMVKKNEFTSQMSATIILNMQSTLYEYNSVMDRDAAEYGIKVAATLLDRALAEGSPVRLCTNGCTVYDSNLSINSEEASGREHVEMLMRTLACLALKSVKDIETLLEELEGEIERSSIVLITPYLTKEILGQLRAFEESMNTVKVILLEPTYDASVLQSDIDVYLLTRERKDWETIPGEGQ